LVAHACKTLIASKPVTQATLTLSFAPPPARYLPVIAARIYCFTFSTLCMLLLLLLLLL
jgi:hypothetical protein